MDKYKVFFVGGSDIVFHAHDCDIQGSLFIFRIYSDKDWREKPTKLRRGMKKLIAPVNNVLAIERI